jgi:hypothetical protein
LYLVSGQLSEPCPLLPFETSVCPTCGEGIKAARGFTWVDGAKFIPPVEHGTPGHNRVCPLGLTMWIDRETNVSYNKRAEVIIDPEGVIPAGYSPIDGKLPEGCEPVSRLGRCGLIWVGVQHYKTPGEFMSEAARMGVSRRITAVPKDFKVGETWVLLGHAKAIEKACSECGDLPETHPEPGVVGTAQHAARAGEPVKVELTTITGPDPECPVCEGTGYEMKPGIITAFKPTAIEYVVKPEEEDDEEFMEGLEKRGITPVKVVKDTDQQAMEV